MKRERSWTHRQYETAYRLCRRTAHENKVYWLKTTPPEIMKAADYSYQANGYNFTGWVNERRFTKFFNAMQGNRYSIWSIPF